MTTRTFTEMVEKSKGVHVYLVTLETRDGVQVRSSKLLKVVPKNRTVSIPTIMGVSFMVLTILGVLFMALEEACRVDPTTTEAGNEY